MTMPQRIQLSRKKGVRLPLGAKSVARPSKWGNPFRATRYWGSQVWTVVGPNYNPLLRLDAFEAREHAVTVYADWLRRGDHSEYYTPENREHLRWIVEHLHELTGLDLACWCPLPDPDDPFATDWCHARILLEESNG